MNCIDCSTPVCEFCHPNCRVSGTASYRFDSGQGLGPFCPACVENRQKTAIAEDQQRRLESEKQWAFHFVKEQDHENKLKSSKKEYNQLALELKTSRTAIISNRIENLGVLSGLSMLIMPGIIFVEGGSMMAPMFSFVAFFFLTMFIFDYAASVEKSGKYDNEEDARKRQRMQELEPTQPAEIIEWLDTSIGEK
jgi:hypothetical protein